MNEFDKEVIERKIDKMFEELNEKLLDKYLAETKYESTILYAIANKIIERCYNCYNCPCFCNECDGKLEYFEDCVDKLEDWMYSIVSKIDWSID